MIPLYCGAKLIVVFNMSFWSRPLAVDIEKNQCFINSTKITRKRRKFLKDQSKFDLSL